MRSRPVHKGRAEQLPRCASSRLLGSLFVGVGRPELAVGVSLVVGLALRAGLALLFLLAIAAKPGERQGFQPLLRNLQSTRFANSVAAFIEPRERVLDL